MVNKKHQAIDAGRAGNGMIDLASGELEFVHEDTRSDSTVLPICVSHIYRSEEADKNRAYGKGFRLNLQQKLIKTAEDGTRYEYYDASGNRHEFEEKYYYKADGENRYHLAGDPSTDLSPIDITEEYDGRLFYIENPGVQTDNQIRHEVFVKLISKSGLALQKGTRNFKGSEKVDRRHEEIVKAEEEIDGLKKNIQDLGFMIDEYSKFDRSYKQGNATFTYGDLVARQRELEDYGLRLEGYAWELQSSKKSITKAGSGNNKSQEGLLELKQVVNGAKILFEEQEEKYLYEQKEIEEYELKLEEYKNKLQMSKTPLTEENNGKCNQTKMLGHKRDILTVTNVLYEKIRGEQNLKWNEYSEGERAVIEKQRELENLKSYVEKYGLDLEEYMIELQSSRKHITKGESGDLESQEGLIELKKVLQGLRVKYDEEKENLIKSQKDMEVYGLGLEEYLFKIQSSKPSIIAAESIEDGKQRESQEQLLDYKRALYALKNIYDAKEEERIKKQYEIQKKTSEEIKEKYESILEFKEYVLGKLNDEIPVNFVIGKDGLILGFNREIEGDDGKTTGGDLVVIFDSYQNRVAVVYEDGLIKKVIDSDGKEVVFDYNSKEMLMSITDFRDRRTLYEYDNEGKLIRVIYQNKEESRFGYDGDGLMTEMVPPSELGPILRYTNGRVTKISNKERELFRIEYPAQSATTVIDAKIGAKASYSFDDKGDCLYEYLTQDGAPKSLVTYDNDDHDVRCSFILSKDKFDDNIIEQTRLNAFGNQTEGDRVFVNGSGTAKAEWTVDVSKLDDHATDYMLYGFASAASLPISGRRRTAYCNCDRSHDGTIPANRRFELRAKVEYGNTNDFDEFIVSFNTDRTTRQLAAIPITLRETDADDVIAAKPTAIIITADYSSNQGMATFERPSLSAGSWTYSVFDAEKNKIQEYLSEHKSDRIENGNKIGKYKIRSMKNFYYDDKNRLIEEESIVRREEWSLDSIPQLTWHDKKEYVTTYEYNKQNKPIRTIGPKGMISETVYDDNGRIVRNVTYHRSNPLNKFYSETERSESGQVTAEIDETGENLTKFEYAEGTNIISGATAPNGQETSFGHYPHTDEIIGMSAVVDDTENSTVYAYSKDRTVLDCGNTRIEYAYDEFGRESAILVDSREYVSFGYVREGNGNDVVTAEYSNGEGYRTISDKFGKVLEIQHNDGSGIYRSVVQNTFDDEDRLIRTTDLLAKESANFTYDDSGNITKEARGDVDVLKKFNSDRNRQTTVFRIRTHEPNGNGLDKVEREQSYTDNYDDEGEFTSITLPTGDVIKTEADNIGRLTKMETPISESEYSYLKRGDHATGIVNRLVNKNKDGTVNRIRYFYDASGNIKEIRDGGKLVARYRYDGLNRLVREDNADLDRTETYEYDGNGNILYRATYPFSVRNVLTGGELIEYIYDGDRLIRAGDEAVEYDVNNLPGNPSSYRGRSLEWSHLRDLRKIDDVGFRYNADGTRIAKAHDNHHVRYHWSGERLLAEKRTSTTSDSVWDMLVDEELPIYTESMFIQYLYGPGGAVGFTIKSNGHQEETYYFQKSLHGDVTHIYSADGSLKARYVYDAWGNHVVLGADGAEVTDVGFIGNINPIRYRGYHFDIETGLYYLKTRYYDPETGRFINADSISYADPDTINGLNLYAYCGSNPVMRFDPTGHEWWNPLTWPDTIGDALNRGVNWLLNDHIGQIVLGSLIIVGLAGLTIFTLGAASVFTVPIAFAALGAIVGGAYGGITAHKNDMNVWAGYWGGAITGAALGAAGPLSAVTGGAAMMVATTFGAGLASYTIETLGNGMQFDVGDALFKASMTTIEGSLSFAFGALLHGKVDLLVSGKNATMTGSKFGNFGIEYYLSRAIAGSFSLMVDVATGKVGRDGMIDRLIRWPLP